MTQRNIGDEIIQGLEGALQYLDGNPKGTVAHTVQVPATVDVKSIRERSGLSQDKFAARYGFAVSALRDWEQGRRSPDRTARFLLTVIAKNPRAVEEALAD
ncbi:helix-turn-helix domain-containing protein [Telmatospirillum siberiense]|uniref:Transcriptional regulator n=1 Tax=Telmatospirillum siberiense TaxID=382514 RepID=A0A2N3PU02_9PROT|nr:helix-turn-helix domain-containing protein [Telmatospirillum siberiense]PKU23870.1 transcriptional regulator [Telmatospirillum siberiense]